MSFQPEEYECPRCPFETAFSSQMKNHLKSHDLSKEQKVFNCADAIESLKCFQCTNFETHNLAHLKHHFKTDHTLLKFEEKLYNCEQCSFQTYSNYLLLRHRLGKLCKKYENKSKPKKNTETSLVRKTRPKRFQCGYCSYRTLVNNDLQRHILVKHTDPNTIPWFHCESCSYKSKTKSSLRKHVARVHGNVEYFKCDHCPFKTKAKYYLKYHNVSKHVEDDKIQWLECAQCSFKAKTPQYLKHHVDTKHGNKKALKCDNCPFETHHYTALREHTLFKHTDREKINYFQCEQCSYRSVTKSNLKKHMTSMHGGEKRFKCEHCPFKTARNHYLQDHLVRKHSEAGPDHKKQAERKI